jgi:hypothetical protein
MVALDRIRLTGLLPKPPSRRGLSFLLDEYFELIYAYISI